MEKSSEREVDLHGRTLQDSDCPVVIVTDLYPGTYYSTDASIDNIRYDFESIPETSDEEPVVLYFRLFDRRVRRLRGLEGEAQHELEEEEIEEQQAMLQNVTGKGIDTIAPDVLAKGLMQDIGELDSCETGGWYMQPYNGAYPIYVVPDCATNPGDITHDTWFSIDCLFCDPVPLDTVVEMVCGEIITSSESGVSTTPTTSEETDLMPSPAPSSVVVQPPSPHTTLNPIIERHVTKTIAPEAAEEEASTCDIVEVENASDNGEYEATEEGGSGRYVYLHSSGASLVWLESADYSPASSEHPLGNAPVKPDPNDRRLAVEGWVASEADAGGRQDARELTFCYEGTWMLISSQGSVLQVQDCAMHPADIETLWLEPFPLADGSAMFQGAYPQVIIRCSGSGSASSSQTGAMFELDEARGSAIAGVTSNAVKSNNNVVNGVGDAQAVGNTNAHGGQGGATWYSTGTVVWPMVALALIMAFVALCWVRARREHKDKEVGVAAVRDGVNNEGGAVAAKTVATA